MNKPKQNGWIPLSDDTIKNGVDVLLKTTDGDIYKTHLSITGTLPDGGEEELKNIEAFMIIKKEDKEESEETCDLCDECNKKCPLYVFCHPQVESEDKDE